MNIQNPIKLTDREQEILKATIEDFIEKNHPISSQFLKQCHFLQFSPATIRNTLANLEANGLLMHPHTSSGRIPTDAGYRYYVDKLIEDTFSQVDISKDILEELNSVASNIDELMQATASMLAKISRLFGVVVISRIQESVLTDIELIPLSVDRIMMILAMKSGLVRSIVLDLKVKVKEKQLKGINSILKEQLIGLSLEDIQDSIDERLLNTHIYDHEIIQILLDNPHSHFNITEDKLVYTSPFIELLNHSEFQEIAILQKTLTALDIPHIKEYFLTHIGPDQEYTLIGKENEDVLLNHCSLMTARFGAERIKGQLAILGPTRLPYKQVKSILENFVEIMPYVC